MPDHPDRPDPQDPATNPEDAPLSRREFIEKSAGSIVKITVAGVAGSSLLAGQAGAQEFRHRVPPPDPVSPRLDRAPQINPSRISPAPQISPSVQRVFELGANDLKFRQELTSNPEQALRSRNIRLAPDDLRTLNGILDNAQNPGGSERFGCWYNMACGYRGY